MRSLTTLATRHKNQLITSAPFIFLVELQDNQDPPRRYRVTNFDKRVHWRQDSLGEPLVYYPAPMTVGDLEESSEGDLPTVEIVIASTGSLSVLDMDSGAGFAGNDIRIVVLSTLDLDSGEAIIDQTARVISTLVTHEGMRFTVAGSDLFQAQFPQFIYSRFSCKWAFGSAQCGYDVSQAGAGFQKCGIDTGGVEVARPFSLLACFAVGDDEDSLGVTRSHPDRFGGEPGIPRG